MSARDDVGVSGASELAPPAGEDRSSSSPPRWADAVGQLKDLLESARSSLALRETWIAMLLTDLDALRASRDVLQREVESARAERQCALETADRDYRDQLRAAHGRFREELLAADERTRRGLLDNTARLTADFDAQRSALEAAIRRLHADATAQTSRVTTLTLLLADARATLERERRGARASAEALRLAADCQLNDARTAAAAFEAFRSSPSVQLVESLNLRLRRHPRVLGFARALVRRLAPRRGTDSR